MDTVDLAVRRVVYARIVADGRPPTVAEVAAELQREEDEIAGVYRRLHDAHALVLRDGALEIRFANPFCFDSTPHRVTASGRVWTATCAWDALGIPAALHADGHIDTECACCGEPIELQVTAGELTRGGGLLAHFVVPARRWWDDIGFT
jgi:alkylmercury lyase-like protein